jgi:3-oxoacyl-[acyl-carrier protein] reductase
MGALADQVALVTGGSRGLGRAVALLFAREGARVIINYRTMRAEVEETQALLPGADREHLALRADVSRIEDVRAMFERIHDECGRLDVLVNNAGVNRDADLRSLTEPMWDEVLATQLKGSFLCAQFATPIMLNNGGGAIINVSSETAMTGRTGACNYIAAKAGVIGLTKALARELAPRIRVNCVAPGYIYTEELAERFSLANSEHLRRIEKEIPLGRIGTPEEAARVVLFLSSDASCYVTGQVLAVGGGRWM